MKTKIEDYIADIRADDADWPTIVDMVSKIKNFKA